MQQITPIEIRQKSFEKSFRGYNPGEVDAFLHSLAYAWEKLITQLSEREAQLEVSKKETQRLQEVENALLRTITDSEVTAKNIIEQAKREAELKTKEVERAAALRTRETEIKAERILHEAQERARVIEEESQQGQLRLQEQREKELERIRKTIQEAETYQDSLLQKFQYLAEDILTRSQLIRRDVEANQPGQGDLSRSAEVPTPSTALETVPAVP